MPAIFFLKDIPSMKGLLFKVPERVSPFAFGGRVIVFLVTLIWGFKFIFHYIDSEYSGQSFLHGVTLAFHEAGHLIFAILGDFMGVLGGTLMQVLVPAICVGAFLKAKDAFAAAVALWWMGENFIDAAPYINDAQRQELILLGGVTGQDVPDFHDWNNILGRLGLLRFDHAIASAVHILGSIIIIAALVWAGYALWLQYKNIER